MPSAPASNRLTEAEGLAWVGFLRAHDLVTQRLDADLRADSDLGLSEFEILLHLAASGGEKRMAQIAHDVVLTGGGVTRIVARLETLGYITKRNCAEDGRGILAALTTKGWAKERETQRIHVESVRRLFLADTSAADLGVLTRFFGKVVQRARLKSQASASNEPCALDEPKAKPAASRKKPAKKAF